MAISKLPLSPFRQDTRIFPTPLSSDVLFSELRDCTRTEIPAYGTPYPDSKKWPDHKLIFVKQVEADQREGLFEFFYAADRQNQDQYNFSFGFREINGRQYRVVNREYLTPRAEFKPLDIPFGTAIEDIPKGKFDGVNYIFLEKEQQRTQEQEFNSLYVAEVCVYVEDSILDVIKSYSKEREDVIPQKFRVSYPTVTTEKIVEGVAEEPVLAEDQQVSREDQINPDLKRIVVVTRDSVDQDTVLDGEQTYVEDSTNASTTETLTKDPSIEKGLYVVQSRSTPLGDGNYVVETVKVDSWPELKQSSWDPLLNTSIVTTKTFVAPPSDEDLLEPYTSYVPVNEDRYLKQTEPTPSDGLRDYKLTVPTRISVDLPAVIKKAQVLWSLDEGKGLGQSTEEVDNVGEMKISETRGKSYDISSQSGASAEFLIESDRFWSRDLPATTHNFFIDRSSVGANVLFTEQDVAKEIQDKFYGPAISNFSASKSTIYSSESVVLNWEVRGANKVKLNGTEYDAVGSLTVSPTSTAVYVLQAESSVGATSAQITINVSPSLGIIQSFDSDQMFVSPLTKIKLSYLCVSGGARFNKPMGIVVDSNGDFFVTDSDNHTIRKINATTGAVTTFAGKAGVSGTADGNGGDARFLFPTGITIDSSDNIYVSDTGNHTIRKISPAGTVSTFAGSAGVYGTSDGTGSAAKFNYPRGITIDSVGNLYVADYFNHAVRKITSTGVVSLFAGIIGSEGPPAGFVLGNNRLTSYIKYPTAIAVGGSDSVIYVSRNYSSILELNTSVTAPNISSFAGSIYEGNTDGVYGSGKFSKIEGFSYVNSNSRLYVTDNKGLRYVDVFNTTYSVSNTPANAAGLVEKSGYLYICDKNRHVIAKRQISGSTFDLDEYGTLNYYGSENGIGPSLVDVKISSDDSKIPEFTSSSSGSFFSGVEITKNTKFKLTATVGNVTEVREIQILVDDQSVVKTWPVFKTSSGSAIVFSKAGAKKYGYSQSLTKAVTETDVYESATSSSNYSYSIDSQVSTNEISNVLTKEINISEFYSIAPESAVYIPVSSSSLLITHKPQEIARSTASLHLPESSPTDIPRSGLYLMDYKVEYYKWGWYRCAATILNASLLALQSND